jgi:hypothetical protein
VRMTPSARRCWRPTASAWCARDTVPALPQVVARPRQTLTRLTEAGAPAAQRVSSSPG